MIAVKKLVTEVFRIMLDDLTVLPDDYRHENRGLVSKENFQLCSCPEYIVFHFYGIFTSVLHFGELS